MAAHYDADRYEEFLEHSAIAEGDLVLAPVALLPSKWVRERRLGVQTKLIATVMRLSGALYTPDSLQLTKTFRATPHRATARRHD